jgi:HPt (histidine-containing phosphotransfer) domain-containing protein
MSSENPESPLFDPAAIEKLRAVAGDQGDSFVKEMAQLFLEETAKAMAEITRARDQGDWRLVSRTAHSIKSSAATLGFMRLSAACKALEFDTKAEKETPRTRGLIDSALGLFETAGPTLKTLA